MIARGFFVFALLSLTATSAHAYEEHGARDPFWPLITASGTIINYGEDVSVSDMVLEGIVSNGTGNYTAIINGSVVEVGDMVGQYQINGIEAKKVILSKDTEIFDLNLKKGGE